MNKRKLTFIRNLTIFVVALLLYNCQKETEIDTFEETALVQKEALFSSRIVYSNEMESNRILSDKLRGLQQMKTGSTNSFTVDTNTAKYTEKADGSIYSYTFGINRDENSSTHVENLVISVNNQTQEVKTVLVTYLFTESQYQEALSTSGHVSTAFDTEITELDEDFSNLIPDAKNYAAPCTFDVTTYHITPDTRETFVYGNGSVCQHPDHNGDSLCEVYTVWTINCPNQAPVSGSNGTDGTDATQSTNTNTTSGSSTTSGNNDTNNEVVTTPILMPYQIITDCMNGNSFNPLLSEDMINWLQNNRLASSQVSNYIQNVGCDESAQDFVEEAIEAMMNEEGLTLEDFIKRKLDELLEEQPFALIETPSCIELQAWQALAMFTPPVEVTNRIGALDNANTTFITDYNLQTLETADGHLVNMDYFPVRITTFPTNPATNSPFTPEEFLTYIRLNLNSLVDNTWATFEPVVYQDGDFTIDDTVLWNSNNPLTALLTLDIPIDEGTVICADHSSSNFTFVTLETPWDSEHPVSGNRDFGFIQENDGDYVFYTRAVDRMTDAFDYAIANTPIPNDVAFTGSDALWSSFQTKLNAYISLNGGSSQILGKKTYRPKWSKVKKVLRGEISVEELDCAQ